MTRLRSQQRSFPAAGFTLVELLTVVAIIGILAAITIVTVGNVRDKARATQCVANLRELHRGFILYVADNKGRFPYDNTSNPSSESSQHWHRRIYPYLSSIPNLSVWPRGAEKIYLCPAGEDSSYSGVISYGINLELLNKTQLQVTTNPILLGDCNNWRLTEEPLRTLQYRHNKQAQVIRLDGSIMSSPRFPTADEEPRLWTAE